MSLEVTGDKSLRPGEEVAPVGVVAQVSTQLGYKIQRNRAPASTSFLPAGRLSKCPALLRGPLGSGLLLPSGELMNSEL